MKTAATSILAILLAGSALAPAAPPSGPKPNIILILGDDAGFADFGCYGGVAQTPVLDRLAKEGVRFTRAYNNGRCWPSRSSLMSGLNPQLAGDDPIGPHCVTLPEMLKQAGYSTAMIDALKETGRDQNTLVLFLSDNGGEPLDQHRALVSNTPFAGWKVSQWEGGISTPLIAWWPGQVPANAINLRHEVRLEDFMATLLDITGLAYPSEFGGRKLFPLQGRSFLPAMKDPNYAGPPRTWCWDHDSQRGVWAAPWKAVYTDRRHPIHDKNTPPQFAGWALFKLDKDRIEKDNLAAGQPEVLQRMIGLWQEWANSVGWKPSQRFPLLPGDAAKPSKAPADPATYDPAKSPIGRQP